MMRKLMIFALLVLWALVSVAGDTRLSTIHLRSGEVVTGTIVTRDDKMVEVMVDGVKYVYTTDEINYITHERKKKNYDTSKFRGFIDLGYSLGVGEPRNDYWLIETSFGYQFTPHYYLGAGIGMHNFDAIVSTYPLRYDLPEPVNNDPYWRSPFIPLYVDGRYNLYSENRHTPWVDLKIGANVINHAGFFLSPSLGMHFATGQYFTINVGVGYALHTAHYKLWCLGDTPGAISDNKGGSYLNKGQAFHNLFVKLGVEF